MPTRKRGLQSSVAEGGRGEGEHPLAGRAGRDESALLIPLGRLRPDPEQPRKTFDERALEDLAASIREHGILQPLLVRAEGDLYYIVAGERRFRAAERVGLDALPARLLGDSNRTRELQLVENLQREDLPLLDEARALAELQAVTGATVRSLEQATGKSKSYIARRLALLKMPADVQALLERAPHLFTQAEALSRVTDEKRRLARIQALERTPEEAALPTTEGRAPGRPVSPFVFKRRRSGAFDLVVKYRPGTGDRAALITQLREALAELEK